VGWLVSWLGSYTQCDRQEQTILLVYNTWFLLWHKILHFGNPGQQPTLKLCAWCATRQQNVRCIPVHNITVNTWWWLPSIFQNWHHLIKRRQCSII